MLYTTITQSPSCLFPLKYGTFDISCLTRVPPHPQTQSEYKPHDRTTNIFIKVTSNILCSFDSGDVSVHVGHSYVTLTVHVKTILQGNIKYTDHKIAS